MSEITTDEGRVFSARMIATIERVVWEYERAILDLEENGATVAQIRRRAYFRGWDHGADTFREMCDVFECGDKITKAGMISLLRRRLAWILRRVDENGIELS